MDIGKPLKRYTVIPLTQPVTAPEPLVPAVPERRQQPAAPSAPAVPEKVPA